MKKIIIIILMISISSLAYSTIIESSVTGNWGDGTTWVGGIIPGAGDTTIINNGHTVSIINGGSITVTGGSVRLLIYGVLNFDNNTSLSLEAGSTLEIRRADTSFTSTTGNCEILVDGTKVWSSNKGLVSGQTAIQENGSAFPIELIEYYVDETNFIFTTASQQNVDRFVIELFNENMVRIGELNEIPCNCLMVKKYIVSIENNDVKYIRLVEYDYDGLKVEFNYLYVNSRDRIDIYEENLYYSMDGKMLRSNYNDLKPGVYIHNGNKIVKMSIGY